MARLEDRDFGPNGFVSVVDKGFSLVVFTAILLIEYQYAYRLSIQDDRSQVIFIDFR
jgi:hypothetical protein